MIFHWIPIKNVRDNTTKNKRLMILANILYSALNPSRSGILMSFSNFDKFQAITWYFSDIQKINFIENAMYKQALMIYKKYYSIQLIVQQEDLDIIVKYNFFYYYHAWSNFLWNSYLLSLSTSFLNCKQDDNWDDKRCLIRNCESVKYSYHNQRL